MTADGDLARLKACYAPDVKYAAKAIFDILVKHKDVASDIAVGMEIRFQGIDRMYLKKVCKSYHCVEITRYSYFIDIFEAKLREQYNKKRK